MEENDQTAAAHSELMLYDDWTWNMYSSCISIN